MVMRSTQQLPAKGGTWKGALFLLILTMLSTLSLSVLGRALNFIFLPAMAVFLWPRLENPTGSIVIILFFGLLLDIISAGPLGLWPLVFLIIFVLFRPHMRLKPRSFGASYGQWFGALALAMIAAYLLGWFAMERRPEFAPLLPNAMTALVAFPFIYGLRHLGRQLLSDPEARG